MNTEHKLKLKKKKKRKEVKKTTNKQRKKKKRNREKGNKEGFRKFQLQVSSSSLSVQ